MVLRRKECPYVHRCPQTCQCMPRTCVGKTTGPGDCSPCLHVCLHVCMPASPVCTLQVCTRPQAHTAVPRGTLGKLRKQNHSPTFKNPCHPYSPLLSRVSCDCPVCSQWAWFWCTPFDERGLSFTAVSMRWNIFVGGISHPHRSHDLGDPVFLLPESLLL